MDLGMIGVGRMGTHMMLKVMKAGHRCVVYDQHPKAVQALGGEGRCTVAAAIDEAVRSPALSAALSAPRWQGMPAP